jgi:Ca2+-binding RTX toxin-like protein
MDSIVPRATSSSPLASHYVWGTGANDTMTGTAGADTMLGYAGNDKISGNAGDDVIYGGWGTDVMNGGAGHDRFVFTSVGSIGIGGLRDKITDWNQGGDLMDLSQIDADVNHAGNQSFTWLGGGAFTGAAGNLRGLPYGGGIVVEGDINGDHAADFQIWLSGQTMPKWSDFVL